MKNIEELKTIGGKPEMLYHYTNIRGLLGILKTNSIWATNIFCLNDAAEYEYAVELIDKEIQKRIGECNIYLNEPPYPDKGAVAPTKEQKNKRTEETTKKYFYESFQYIMKNLKHFHIYICSFSENKDQLSQWRGYCSSENGFSIGFKTLELEKQMNKHGFKLVRCIYNKEDQESTIKDELNKWTLDKINHALEKYGKIRGLGKRLNKNEKAYLLTGMVAIQHMMNIIPIIKHESFEEEAEWRFCSHLSTEEIKNVKFREGKSMAVPYYDIPLENKETQTKISHIIVGPTSHQDLSKRSIEELLVINKYKRNECKIENSISTYRTV